MEPGEQTQRIRVGNSSKSPKAIFLPAQSWCSPCLCLVRWFLDVIESSYSTCSLLPRKDLCLFIKPSQRNEWSMMKIKHRSKSKLRCFIMHTATHRAQVCWSRDKAEKAGGKNQVKQWKRRFLCSCSQISQHLKASTTEEGFPGGSAVKNLSATQEMRVWSPVWKNPLENEMSIHSSILAWEIPWMEEPEGLVNGVVRTPTQLGN